MNFVQTFPATAEHRSQLVRATFVAASNHHRDGRLIEAGNCYRQVLALDDRHDQSLNGLAIIALKSGRAAAAAELFSRAIAIRGDVAAYHHNLALALKDDGRLEDAAAALQRAVALNPNDAESCNNLGVALRKLGRLEESVACYGRAIAARPNYAEAHNNLGVALWVQDRSDEAVARFTHAIALKPDYGAAHGNLGNALRDDGKLEEAQRAYETAVRFEPQLPRHYLNLLRMRPVVAGDPYLAAMEALAGNASRLPIEDQSELHFALGKAYADLGQHARAMRSWLAGNALKRRQLAYDEPATLRLFDRIRGVFTRELLAGARDRGDPSGVPIFIVGMPRSGTTLAEQILASHPQVHGAGELRDLCAIVAGLDGPAAAATDFPEIVPALSGEQLRDIGARYLAAVRAASPQAARITDKMPDNVRFAGLIALALPNARIIHMRRDPIDICVSCFATPFAEQHPYSYDLAELGRYVRAYEALAAHWRDVLPAGMMLEVSYEALVADLEPQARRIVAHCGLDWSDACLAFHQTRRPVRTASAVQVRQPIYRTSVGRSLPYRDLLRPLLDALGPQPTSSMR